MMRLSLQQTGRAIFRAATLVGVLTLIVKLLATGKEMLVAYRLGVDTALDAFLVAYLFPSFLVNVIGGSLTCAFVPLYVEIRNSQGEAAAAWLVRGLTIKVVALLVALSLFTAPIFAALVPKVAHGFDAETVALSQRMVFQLAPVFVLNALTAFWTGALNARERFALGALVPALTPTMVMVLLLLCWDSLGVMAIVVGTLLGAACESALVGRRALAHTTARAQLPGARLPMRELLQQLLPVIAGTVIMSGTTVVDQMMASSLSSGSVAALSYGSKLTVVIVGVGSMALATAFLPHFSRMVSEGDTQGIRWIVRQYSIFILLATGAVTAVLVFGSEFLVRLLYGRGAFDEDAVELVTRVQWMYALQIPFFTFSMMAVRLISALRKNQILMIGAAVSLTLNVFLNWLFSRYLGVAGIALSTSVVAAIACGFLWVSAWCGIRSMERAKHDALAAEGL